MMIRGALSGTEVHLQLYGPLDGKEHPHRLEKAMSNYSYLCATNSETTYPSFTDPNYASSEQTVACDVWCVPLLWLGLFRRNDIVTRTFDVEGDKVYTEAPLVDRMVALKQLEESLSYFNEVFREEGPLDEYCAFLRQAVSDVGLKYLTIELQEIACLSDEQQYYDTFRAALGAIGSDTSPKAKQRLIDIAQIKAGRPFPPARLHLDDLDGEEEDFWNHCRICGAGEAESGIGRPVPWEVE